MRPTRRYIVTMGLLLAAAPAMGALTAEQKCQAGKNQAAGKYADCRQKAEASLVKTGDATKHATAISKCETKFQTKWQKLIDAATAAGATCPDAPLTRPDFQSVIDEHTDNLAQALGGGGLGDCSSDLATCTADLGTCTGDLSTCNTTLTSTQTSLTTCTGDLGTCTTSLTACTGTLGTCTGDLSTCNGSLGTCNSTLSATQASLTTCTANLSACASGTAAPADVLSGKTFAGGGLTGQIGTMPNNGAVALTPGTAPVPVAAGYHNGSGTVAGDADLVASNISSGVDIFGVTGTALPAQRLKTGQTQCYNASGSVIACAGTGQDGELQKGVARTYVDNGNGTVTDTKTGLTWEKLDDNNTGGIHDADNPYNWTTAVTTKIAALNTPPCFADQCDWRLPNRNELESLADLGRVNPAIDPAFNTACTASCTVTTCSCTRTGYFWSSTAYQYGPDGAWVVYFYDGDVYAYNKTSTSYVRAVRGGS